MVLYVCLVLTAEFVILSETEGDRATVLGVIWGTTIGLTLAHLFAFDLAQRLFSKGRPEPEHRSAILLQLMASAAVALVLTIPVALLPLSTAFDVCALLTSLFVGNTAFGVERTSGRTWVQSAIFGVGALILGVRVVLVKVALTGY
jgi:hypothetical protein